MFEISYFSDTYFHFCLDFTLVGLTIVCGMELEKSGFSNNEPKITLRNWLKKKFHSSFDLIQLQIFAVYLMIILNFKNHHTTSMVQKSDEKWRNRNLHGELWFSSRTEKPNSITNRLYTIYTYYFTIYTYWME